MRKSLLFLSLILFIHLNWTDLTECINAELGQTECTSEYTGKINMDELLNDNEMLRVYSPMDRLIDNAETRDLQSMARQIRTASSRAQKLIVLHEFFSPKFIIKQISDHTTNLTSCAARNFTTLRCLSWEVASDCYVFGMRRILI